MTFRFQSIFLLYQTCTTSRTRTALKTLAIRVFRSFVKYPLAILYGRLGNRYTIDYVLASLLTRPVSHFILFFLCSSKTPSCKIGYRQRSDERCWKDGFMADARLDRHHDRPLVNRRFFMFRKFLKGCLKKMGNLSWTGRIIILNRQGICGMTKKKNCLRNWFHPYPSCFAM